MVHNFHGLPKHKQLMLTHRKKVPHIAHKRKHSASHSSYGSGAHVLKDYDGEGVRSQSHRRKLAPLKFIR